MRSAKEQATDILKYENTLGLGLGLKYEKVHTRFRFGRIEPAYRVRLPSSIYKRKAIRGAKLSFDKRKESLTLERVAKREVNSEFINFTDRSKPLPPDNDLEVVSSKAGSKNEISDYRLKGGRPALSLKGADPNK
ncbi:hypothetical protein BHE74_00022426 [Ensete ventricosum]|nr:hypothetical protein GW17_00040295 [Ensete ventricosum]RWW69937.1 hypothetical protein BHE74_00022426 [Ensete ventricosum]RZR99047.1 hypothetical protein BHM03_00028518 [Ensete ventricosum]